MEQRSTGSLFTAQIITLITPRRIVALEQGSPCPSKQLPQRSLESLPFPPQNVVRLYPSVIRHVLSRQLGGPRTHEPTRSALGQKTSISRGADEKSLPSPARDSSSQATAVQRGSDSSRTHVHVRRVGQGRSLLCVRDDVSERADETRLET
jgi:hypothetical protein